MEPRDLSLTPNEPEKETTMNEELTTEPQAETTEATISAEATEAPAQTTVPATKETIIEAVTTLSQQPAAEITADEVSRLKQQFYALRQEEQRAEKEEFVANGNDESQFVARVDEAEEKFKELLAAIKEKKAAYRAMIEEQRRQNYERKQAIIKELNEMSADTDNVHRHFPKAKDLQAEYKSIGEVPPTVAADLWKEYQEAIEHFYDQHKINKELRDYDFKKNLAEKQLICEEADRLVVEPDVIVAFKRLQELHEKWREIGPVAKDVREEIWQRFKDASAQINKRYQAFFEERKNRERENEEAKTAICERIEALDFSTLNSYAAWDNMTKEIMKAQEDWRKLGFASKKMNNALFSRFRATCDKFFAQKAEFFKQMKDTLAENLEKKIALCERAEALKDSTEWRKATEEFVALQKEWKTIGTVAKKHSDNVWRRFLAACDYFFDQKKKSTSGTRKAEQANLKAKREIIRSLSELDPEASREDTLKAVRELQARWQETGHVPFSEKDKIYDEYRKVVNALYDSLDMRQSRARMANFESNLSKIEGDENQLYRERERLARAFEQRKSELQTYENNLGFFNSKSKSGDSMVKEMERKIQRLKDDIADLRKKIEVIDAKL